MKKEKIILLGIDEFDRLFVKPEIETFSYIYRAAMEVNWDEKRKVLFSPKPREWSYQKCFEQIINAVKNECNINLVIDENTVWENIDSKIKDEIVQKIKFEND
ncbi:MAG: hypothetical protein IPH62_00690 [Ignavibacteriae bacterium]|nr:hypothetical protein [Ignavibacteriota bacterium]